ncbi:hypothetical protein GCM10009127_02790 [Alteraurantiacibacter aestuarii]|uniref:Peptide O-xylosyltransferase n=1 Tax=Alteraurantiacibacter aestuarii TaxID=650004 RepID=A0A844ZNR5_9SPHN|nr:beta-1,6-N-acetylglucosaminyltransferase [Alteraurantiacibacter aestuarii]MXO88467.1 hypothetical protein [Alteraurantiacibacter aestuarii]
MNRIAFLLLTHDDPAMTERLCTRLAPHRVFVHVDAKATGFPVERIEALDNVTVIKTRETVFWASFPMVKAILALMRAALADGEQFLRLMLISGTCYPVRPLDELVRHFEENPGHQDLALVKVAPGSHLAGLSGRHWALSPMVSWTALKSRPALARADTALRNWRNRFAKLIGRDISREIDRAMYFGSTWWAMTPDACRFALEQSDQEPRLAKAFTSVWAADEQFFQTIMGNSAYAPACVPVTDRGGETLYEAPLHFIYPTGTRDFGNTDSDFDMIRNSGKYFARKLTSARNAPLLDRIDRELLNPGS